jgi:hypothetical protein
LKDTGLPEVRVLLAGFSWAGRTSEDVIREARELGGPNIKLTVVENLSQKEHARYLAKSKLFVFLAKKEGDNKALVEAMFANVPALVYRDTKGGAPGRINTSTGMLSSDAELPAAIRHMLTHHQDFQPRSWALENSGSTIATHVLEKALRHEARSAGSTFSGSLAEKVNSPNLAYRTPSDRSKFQRDYDFIVSCIRDRIAT